MPSTTTTARFACAPLTFGLLAWIFALSGGLWCTLIEVDSALVDPETNGTRAFGIFRFGLFYRQETSVLGTAIIADPTGSSLVIRTRRTCVPYNSDEGETSSIVDRDQKWNSSRALQITAYVSGGLGVALGMAATCCGCVDLTNSNGGGIMGICFLVTTLFQGLTYLVMQSDLCRNNPVLAEMEATWSPFFIYARRCSIGTGSVLVIMSVCMYFLASLTSYCATVAAKEELQQQQEEEEEEEETQNPAAADDDEHGGGSGASGGNDESKYRASVTRKLGSGNF